MKNTFYNEYGFSCRESGNRKITVTGLINLDGEEEIISVTVDEDKIDEVDFTVLINQYLKTVRKEHRERKGS